MFELIIDLYKFVISFMKQALSFYWIEFPLVLFFLFDFFNRIYLPTTQNIAFSALKPRPLRSAIG